jgi:16S rRNA (cytidine1402-2'-O)-methyltransferase
MPTDKFVFEGFLPSGKTKRRKRLKELTCEERTMVFYESPHRLIEMLKDIHDILGNRRAAVIRELTKLHEEIKRGALLEIIKYFEQQKPRGEFTIVLSGAQREKLNVPISSEEVITKVKEFTDKGMSTKDAVRKTAELFKIPKREVYDIVNKAFN